MVFINPKTDFANYEDVISHFVFKEKQKLFDYPTNELETLTDKWIYFRKNTTNLETVPETMGTVPEIQKAFSIANEANLSRQELEDLEKREMFIEDQRGAIIKGIQEGRLQGKLQGQQDLIVRLLARRFGNVESEIQSRIRQLSSEQLENLGEAILDFASTSDLNNWLQAQQV
jgi:predicted transposase/invertase (TIGR01784 family)